jgi:tRNA threonylcarbamoyladenosine biosynthesis protein TsaE
MSTVHRHIAPPLAPRGELSLTRDELVAWGSDLGRATNPPLVIGLSGELGAGKTTLAQAICAGYGVDEDVTSPTFALVHVYASPKSPVFHVDLYRLTGPEQLTNIGWDDILSSDALVLVEWPTRAGDQLPANLLAIELKYAPGDPDRRILLAG